MQLQINRMHFPVTVLGPGRRVGIWFQGCSIGCPGCLSRDTWDTDAQRAVEIRTIVSTCRELSSDNLDGITISGGEPFEQPEGLLALLDELDAWRTASGLTFDILCYSGKAYRWLQRHHHAILNRLDAVVPEPYVHTLPQADRWRGSANQPLIALSELGRARYEVSDSLSHRTTPELQLAVDGQRIWMIGLPRPADLDSVRGALAGSGIVLEGLSWRT